MLKMRGILFSALLTIGGLAFGGCGGGGGEGASPATSGGQISLEVLWGGPMSPGDSLQVRLMAKDLPGVFQSSLRLNYDTTKLRYLTFQPGGFWTKENDSVTCRQVLSQVRDFTASGVLLVVVSRPGKQCGNTDKINGEMGRITMTAIAPIGSPAGLVRFSTDPSRLLVRNAAGDFLTLRQRTDAQLSFTLASP